MQPIPVQEMEASLFLTVTTRRLDTRMVRHACLNDTPVVAVSKHTDVLVLLMHAFTIKQPTKDWFMKID